MMRQCRRVWFGAMIAGVVACLGVMACRPEVKGDGTETTTAKVKKTKPEAETKTTETQTANAATTASAALETPAPTPAANAPRMSDKLTTEGIRMLQGEPGVVRLTWTTQSEENSFGFNVMRAKTEGGPFAPVNERPLMGAGVSSTAQQYVYHDQSVKVGEVYYYFIRQIDLDGTTKDFKEWTSRVTVNRLNLDRATSATAETARANAATTGTAKKG